MRTGARALRGMSTISNDVRIMSVPVGAASARTVDDPSTSKAAAYAPGIALVAATTVPAMAVGLLRGMRMGATVGSGFGVVGGIAGALAGAAIGIAAARGIGSLLHRVHGVDERAPAAMPTQSPRDVAAPAEQVRVMTINMHGGMGPGSNPAEASLEALARRIEQEKPDIVMLQEVDDFAMRSAWRDQVDWLCRRLAPDGMAFASSGTMVTGRQQGEMVLTFNGFSVKTAQNIHSPDPYGNGIVRRIAAMIGQVGRFTGINERPGGMFSHFSPRNSVDALVRTPEGREVRVVSSHLAGTFLKDGVAMQVQPIVDALEGWHGPTLVGGDFNAGDASKAGKLQAQMLAQVGLADTFTSAGIALGDPLRSSVPGYASGIDRIHASGDFAVQDIHVITGTRVSDHDPVVTNLVLS